MGDVQRLVDTTRLIFVTIRAGALTRIPLLAGSARSNNHMHDKKEIISFIRQNPQRNLSYRQLYDILYLYENWRKLHRNGRTTSFEKRVLRYIAERVFWSDFQDEFYIEKFLGFLYQAYNHFGFFLCPQAEHFVSLEYLDEVHVRLSHYFLNHAYRQHLTFKGKRIVDMKVNFRGHKMHPCEMAVLVGSPLLLHLFLQYGALIMEETGIFASFRSHPVTGNILKITLRIIKSIIDQLQTDSTVRSTDKFKNLIHCGLLITRAIPQIEKRVMRRISMELPGFNSPEQALDWVADNSALRNLRHRCSVPVPLKHACRLKIRKILHHGWQLPYGIDNLPVPDPLKNYLNLYYD